ncbi:MAG TPA: isochorismatase family cysteine hydrolase [Terriglobales bacterium]|nr:isochorismatase family cysteine hydrolase [Terriglobales bacterium]
MVQSRFLPGAVLWEVDVQADFMLPGGKLYVPGAEKIIATLEKLVTAGHQAGALLISSADAHNPEDPELKQWPPHCMKDSPGAEIIPEGRLSKTLVVPNDKTFQRPTDLHAYDQIIIQKNELDVFSNPHTNALLALLKHNRVREDAEFLVFGVVTEYCVQFAAGGLLQRGKRVAVVTDAIKEIDLTQGECSLRDFQAQGARLTTSAEVIKSLAAQSRRSA